MIPKHFFKQENTPIKLIVVMSQQHRFSVISPLGDRLSAIWCEWRQSSAFIRHRKYAYSPPSTQSSARSLLHARTKSEPSGQHELTNQLRLVHISLPLKMFLPFAYYQPDQNRELSGFPLLFVRPFLPQMFIDQRKRTKTNFPKVVRFVVTFRHCSNFSPCFVVRLFNVFYLFGLSSLVQGVGSSRFMHSSFGRLLNCTMLFVLKHSFILGFIN